MNIENNDAFSEDFDSNSEFHKQIQACLKMDGELVCIAWSKYVPTKPWVGIAIMSRETDLVTRRFSVLPGKTQYGLKLMRRAYVIQSDYFEDMPCH